jgi:uncharacterized membrane protein (GlpM family)
MHLGPEDLARFVIGGAVVALVPILSRQLGPTAGGIASLIPAQLILVMIFLHREAGSHATSQALIWAMIGLPTLLVFLAVAYFVLKSSNHVVLAMGVATAVWVVLALVVTRLAGTGDAG